FDHAASGIAFGRDLRELAAQSLHFLPHLSLVLEQAEDLADLFKHRSSPPGCRRRVARLRVPCRNPRRYRQSAPRANPWLGSPKAAARPRSVGVGKEKRRPVPPLPWSSGRNSPRWFRHVTNSLGP